MSPDRDSRAFLERLVSNSPGSDIGFKGDADDLLYQSGFLLSVFSAAAWLLRSYAGKGIFTLIAFALPALYIALRIASQDKRPRPVDLLCVTAIACLMVTCL